MNVIIHTWNLLNKQPGNPETRQPGNPETRQPGNPETRKPANPPTRNPQPATRNHDLLHPTNPIQ